MRALLAPLLLLVLVAGCVSGPTDAGQPESTLLTAAAPAPSEAVGLAALQSGAGDVSDDTFDVSMTDPDPQVFLITQPQQGPVTITLTVLRGVYEGLRLQGPEGPCRDADMGGGQVIPGSAPAIATIDCGMVDFGQHFLQLSVGFGMASGKITVSGAEILIAGEGA